MKKSANNNKKATGTYIDTAKRLKEALKKMPDKDNGKKYNQRDLARDLLKNENLEASEDALDKKYKYINAFFIGLNPLSPYYATIIGKALNNVNPQWLLGKSNIMYLDYEKMIESKSENDKLVKNGLHDLLKSKGYIFKPQSDFKIYGDTKIRKTPPTAAASYTSIIDCYEIQDENNLKSYIIRSDDIEDLIEDFISLMKNRMIEKELIEDPSQSAIETLKKIR